MSDDTIDGKITERIVYRVLELPTSSITPYNVREIVKAELLPIGKVLKTAQDLIDASPHYLKLRKLRKALADLQEVGK